MTFIKHKSEDQIAHEMHVWLRAAARTKIEANALAEAMEPQAEEPRSAMGMLDYLVRQFGGASVTEQKRSA